VVDAPMDPHELHSAYQRLAAEDLSGGAAGRRPRGRGPRRRAAEEAEEEAAALALALEILSDVHLRRAYERCGGDIRAMGSGFDALADFLEARRAEEEKEAKRRRRRRRSPPPSSGRSAPSAAAPPPPPPPPQAPPPPPNNTINHSAQLDVFTVTGLTPSEAVTGAERVVEFSARRACGQCDGRGALAAALDNARRCGACAGRGRVSLRRWAAADGGDALISFSPTVASTATTTGACPACGGTGLAAPPPPCPACQGEGLERGGAPAPQRLRLRVPPGVIDGQVLRVRGYGHEEEEEEEEKESSEEDDGEEATPPPFPRRPRRHRRGDLYVRLDVHLPLDGSAGFKRVPGTDDVTSELRLCIFDALLGAEVGVATARGEKRLRVPAGTQHGERLVIAGAGVPRGDRAGGGAGDHVFRVVVVVPRPGELVVEAFGGGEEPPPPPPPLLRELRAAARWRQDGEAGILML
jgi:DnaJ-class molecular chaperone